MATVAELTSFQTSRTLLAPTYAKGKKPLPKDILKAMVDIVPLANLMDSQISALRHWAKGRAREAATRDIPPRQQRRRISEQN